MCKFCVFGAPHGLARGSHDSGISFRVQVPDAVIDQIIREADANGDGCIDFAEFVVLMKGNEH